MWNSFNVVAVCFVIDRFISLISILMFRLFQCYSRYFQPFYCYFWLIPIGRHIPYFIGGYSSFIQYWTWVVACTQSVLWQPPPTFIEKNTLKRCVFLHVWLPRWSTAVLTLVSCCELCLLLLEVKLLAKYNYCDPKITFKRCVLPCFWLPPDQPWSQLLYRVCFSLLVFTFTWSEIVVACLS